MRGRTLQIIVSLLAIVATGPVTAQITSNPVPAPIEKRGLAVEIMEMARLPDTRGICPADQDVKPAGWARINYVRDLPDGRRFANDLRGFLYRIDANNQPHVYANLAETFPRAVYNRLSSGFIAFVFHPEFARNGLFYTIHAEHGPDNPVKPNFIPPGYGLKDVTHHNIVTEWHATNPAANVFAGTRRELLRTAHVVANLTHPLSAVEFNPTAKPGSEDYGLLYISGSDHGFSNGGGPNSSNPAQDAASRFDHNRDAAHRSAQSVGHRRRERPRRRPFPWPTNSPRTAIRTRWGRSTPTDFATPTGCHGTSTGPCSSATSG